MIHIFLDTETTGLGPFGMPGRHAIPSRMLRHCTDKWKIKPMNKYIQSHYPGEDLTVIIGFAYDEMHRANCSIYKNQQAWYPLIEKKMTRRDCIQFIMEQGYPVPPKSGCFYCPYQRLDAWKSLMSNHPDLIDRAIRLEKNNSNYPVFTLSNFRKKGKPLTLEEVYRNMKTTLFEFDDVEEMCAGACMT